VRELHLVNISRASVDEQQVVARALVGVCFDTANTAELSEHIRDEFQQLGFFNAKVSSLEVDALDRSATPPTISVNVSVVIPLEGGHLQRRQGSFQRCRRAEDVPDEGW
jgi:hypothetical protein